MTIITMKDRLLGGLYGLLVGDALGVPYEFHSASQLPDVEQIEMQPPVSFSRTYPGIRPGTWSDDGAQALALLDALLESGSAAFYNRFADNLVAWQQQGRFAVDNQVFDQGITSSRAIALLARRTDDGRNCGLSDERSNGNGSLMRVLPLVLIEPDRKRLFEHSMAQSKLTHAHPRSQICCAMYCQWAHGILLEEDGAWKAAMQFVEQHLPVGFESEFARVQKELEEQPTGTGYVVDCLRSALAANTAEGYEAIVRQAIAYGTDTDTTACVAGGIAGLRYGVDGIPERWLQMLRGREILEPLADQMLRRRLG